MSLKPGTFLRTRTLPATSLSLRLCYTSRAFPLMPFTAPGSHPGPPRPLASPHLRRFKRPFANAMLQRERRQFLSTTCVTGPAGVMTEAS